METEVFYAKNEWFYMKDGQRFGPVSGHQLNVLATKCQIEPADLVWKPGMATWVPHASLELCAIIRYSPSTGHSFFAWGSDEETVRSLALQKCTAADTELVIGSVNGWCAFHRSKDGRSYATASGSDVVAVSEEIESKLGPTMTDPWSIVCIHSHAGVLFAPDYGEPDPYALCLYQYAQSKRGGPAQPMLRRDEVWQPSFRHPFAAVPCWGCAQTGVNCGRPCPYCAGKGWRLASTG